MDREERELIRRCLQRDQDACTHLVDKYAQMVGTVIWRATGDHNVVEDLVQETFLRMFRGLPYFDARAKLSTWLYTIAHRVAIDHVRQAGRWREEMGERDQRDRARVEAQRASGSDPERAAVRQELDELVREQLLLLPDKYRIPLAYAALDGLDYGTIGSMLGVKPGTVKTLVFRAKQLLKDRIDAVLNQPTGRERTHAV